VRSLAKKHGVKLFHDCSIDPDDWKNDDTRKKAAQACADDVKDHQFDGVFFDFEGTGLSASKKADYTKMAQEATAQLKPLGAQLFVCVGGRPSYELRNYDYAGLADASDFLFVMGYDLHLYDDYTCVKTSEGNVCSPAEASIRSLTAGVNEYLEQAMLCSHLPAHTASRTPPVHTSCSHLGVPRAGARRQAGPRAAMVRPAPKSLHGATAVSHRCIVGVCRLQVRAAVHADRRADQRGAGDQPLHDHAIVATQRVHTSVHTLGRSTTRTSSPPSTRASSRGLSLLPLLLLLRVSASLPRYFSLLISAPSLCRNAASSDVVTGIVTKNEHDKDSDSWTIDCSSE